MYRYALFGRSLQSELAFPDLSPAAGQPVAWMLRVASEDEMPPDGVLLGEKEVWESVARTYQTAAGCKVEYPHVGTYLVSPDGSRFTWYPLPNAPVELSRTVVLGAVIAVALHVTNTLCLHGSAVAVGAQALGFLAPKFFGKSTLALSLAAAGARLITDDAIAIDDVGGLPRVRPGVHSIRLLEDSVQAVGASDLPATLIPGGKYTLSNLAEHMLSWEDVPLAALYLLHPVKDDIGGDVIRREALGRLRAALSIVAHTKLGSSLAGPSIAGDYLRWASALAKTVPVYALEVPRSYERLPAVVAQIFEWHSESVLVGPDQTCVCASDGIEQP